MNVLMRNLCLLPTCAVLVAGAADIPIDAQFDCPAQIDQASLPPAKAPTGWASSTRGSLQLHAIDLSYGPPSEMAFLKPRVVTRRDKSSYYEWNELLANDTVGNLWMACSYGRSDHHVLGKQLDNKFSKCIAIEAKDKQGRAILTLSCRP